MAWEKHAGRAYYYRSVRVGSAVKKVYCGGARSGGSPPRWMYAAGRNAGTGTPPGWPRNLCSPDFRTSPGRSASGASCLPTPCSLSAAFTAPIANHGGSGMQPVEQCNPLPEPPGLTEIRTLVQRARRGDAGVLPRLRQILDEHPEVWQVLGDLEKVVVRAWAGLLGGEDPLATESIRRKAEKLRADLEGDTPTAVERLLVGNVVTSWLELNHAQVMAAQAQGTTAGQATYNLRRAERRAETLPRGHEDVGHAACLAPSWAFARQPPVSVRQRQEANGLTGESRSRPFARTRRLQETAAGPDAGTL